MMVSWLQESGIVFGLSLAVHSLLCCLLSSYPVDEIFVDINFPEQNREVQVVSFTDVEKDGVLHNGFDIMMDVDI